MDEKNSASPDRIENSFRYGSASIIGVLTGFSLAFLTAWAANPLPWELNDLFGLVPLILGIILEVVAVAGLLDPRSLELARYRRVIRYFMTGLILVGIGVAVALLVDLLALIHPAEAVKVPG